MPHADDDTVLLVISMGNPAYRSYCLESAARRHRLVLVDSTTPTWQLAHIVDHEVADPHDLAALRGAVARLADRHTIAGVLTWDEYCLLPAAQIATDLALPGQSSATAAACRNKAAARAVWAAEGVPSAQSIRATSLVTASTAARRIGYPVVLKPAAHAASIGVIKVERAEDLPTAFAYTCDHAGDQGEEGSGVLVEEYLDGPEISVECVTVHGITTPVAVTRKMLGPEPLFQEVGHTVRADDPLLAQVGPIAEAALDALGVNTGVSHVEMRLTAGGPRLIEVNARLGGDLIGRLVQLATGIDLPAVAADIAVGREPDLTPTRREAAGVRFLSPAASGTLQRAEARPELGAPDWLERLCFEHKAGEQILLPDHGGNLHTGRLAHFVVTGTDTDQIHARLEQVANLLDVEVSEAT
ncbi:ATP-grasp domain-containing protein [Kitasatospora sp. YST-16]|uniref:ATP-grasp domain-containing protein n=1 Tax=Kitasatospora sp. YST-16 TaxID=2998080 RepID=UPI0022850AF8|nr:ATP-grasp domain-containing protein [Kitasatospora sp. YST-16]WAL74581.1 ATP-grasp domain-containing protein [Kitasatospora sp. YST-16]WNW40639.1 ATP-grasp domain-containing protein [Streptomyces sp. Li-HN-5-13]